MASRFSATRRQVLKTGAALVAIAGVGSPVLAATKRPNILYIMADDLGYADLSCYGRREYQTPAIDSLARDGVKFERAYANSPVCSATRTALMTGRYQYRLAVGLEEPLAQRDVGLPPEHPTLPSLLKKAGYRTALIGKWHLGSLPKYGPLQSGYDHFWGFRGGGLDYFHHTYMGKPDLWDDDKPISEPGYMTGLLGQKAIDLIRDYAASDQPFLISLHFNAPHWPWEGPDDKAEADRLASTKNIWAISHYDGGSMKTYAEMVTQMDLQIGRILQCLTNKGLAENTIVIFTSDNGGERYSDTWPFTGKKGELLEGGLRVPALLRWPARIPGGMVHDDMMITMDWVATLLAAAGAKHDPQYPLDGINLLPTLLTGDEKEPRTLYWRYLLMRQEACCSGDWKYLKINDNSFLFNIKSDPLERANLKDQHPEKLAELVTRYRAWDRTMLPLDPNAYSFGFTADKMADHFGNGKHVD